MMRNRSKLIWVAALFGIAGATALVVISASQSDISLVMTQDSVWGRQELIVRIDSNGEPKSYLTLLHRSGFGDRSAPPIAETENVLENAEAAHVRTLVNKSDLFSDQSWGRDERGGDHSLVTLEVIEDGKVAVLVCSGNKSFEGGARQELLHSLSNILERMTKEFESQRSRSR